MAGIVPLALSMAVLSAEVTKAPTTDSGSATHETDVASISSEEIAGWDDNPPAIRALLDKAVSLTQQHLRYAYGSADPAKGGMDCSGTMYYLLRQGGWTDVPRQANEFYVWLRKQGLFRSVLSTNNQSFELNELKPGDLLFWTGTYDIDRDPPITHVMIYLGQRKSDQSRVMMGASEGRYYQGKARYGVSTFDFHLPGFPPPASYKTGSARFVGYASLPPLPTLVGTDATAPPSRADSPSR